MNGWPDDFDFDQDETCQRVFRPFIEMQLDNLKKYDAQRHPDILYIFHTHAKRVSEDVYKACLYLGLSENAARNMRWAMLPHDIGKTLLPVAVWDSPDKPDAMMKKLRRSHTLLGAQMVSELAPGYHDHPFKKLMTDIMVNHHEQMDGGGYIGLQADQLSLPVRLASLVEAFDGWSIPRPHFGKRDVSVPSVLERIRSEKSGMFDMRLFEAFAEMKLNEYKKTA